MSNIFISYNRESESITRILVNDIESLGHIVRFDQELSGGQTWWNQILSMIRDCDLCVLVLSQKSLNSIACMREYSYAADLGKPILPILVDEGIAISLLPPSLVQIQFVDYRRQDRDAAFRLARALITIPPPQPLPNPLPFPPDVPISYLGGISEKIEAISTLSYEDQSSLLIDLKMSLGDSETAVDARTLLQRLRRRRDLFATIAGEIDILLRSENNPPSTASHDSGMRIEPTRKSPVEEIVSVFNDKGVLFKKIVAISAAIFCIYLSLGGIAAMASGEPFGIVFMLIGLGGIIFIFRAYRRGRILDLNKSHHTKK